MPSLLYFPFSYGGMGEWEVEGGEREFITWREDVNTTFFM